MAFTRFPWPAPPGAGPMIRAHWAFRRHKLEQQFRGCKANPCTLLSAPECILPTTFNIFERCDFERHSFHFNVSMLQRHSRNRLTVSLDQ
jgi:hypothetical protein